MITYLIKPFFYYLFCCPNPQRAIADLERDQPFQNALQLVIQRQASNSTPILHVDAILLIEGTLDHALVDVQLSTIPSLKRIALSVQYHIIQWIRHYEANQAFNTIFKVSRFQIWKSMLSQKMNRKASQHLPLLHVNLLESILGDSLYDIFILKEITEYTYYTARDKFVRDFVSFPYLQLQRYCQSYNQHFESYLVFLVDSVCITKLFFYFAFLYLNSYYPDHNVHNSLKSQTIYKPYLLLNKDAPLFYLHLNTSTMQLKEKFKKTMINCQKEESFFIMKKIALDYQAKEHKIRLKEHQYKILIEKHIKWIDSKIFEGIQEVKEILSVLIKFDDEDQHPIFLEQYPYLECQGARDPFIYAFYLRDYLAPRIEFAKKNAMEVTYASIRKRTECFSYSTGMICFSLFWTFFNLYMGSKNDNMRRICIAILLFSFALTTYVVSCRSHTPTEVY